MSISSSECADLGAPRVAEALGDLRQLLLDHAEHARLVAEDRPQLGDPLGHVGVLLFDAVGLERGELGEAQVEDRRRLDRAQLEALDQLLAGGVAVARAADQLDDRVEVVERGEQALEDVRASLLFGELVLGAAHDHLALVRDVVVDDRAQVERARHVVDERDHVDAEGGLHRRVLVELVEHDLRDRVALELDHQAHAALVRVVLDVGDLGDAAVFDEVGDLLDQAAVAALLDHERQLGDDDRLFALLERLDVGTRLDAHAAATGLVGVADAGAAEDHPARREVGALDVLHQARDVDRRVVDVGDRRVDHLAQVVRAGCSSPSRRRSRRTR